MFDTCKLIFVDVFKNLKCVIVCVDKGLSI